MKHYHAVVLVVIVFIYTQSGIASMQLDMNRYTFSDLVYSACRLSLYTPEIGARCTWWPVTVI